MIAKLTLRNLRANLGRFTMTTFGVVLAVSFVVSAFVMGDGLRKTFGDLSSDIVTGTDMEIRPVDEFGAATFLTDDDVEEVLTIPGVDNAAGLIAAGENSVRPITGSGEEIPVTGPPQLAFNWVDAPGFSPFTLVEGSAPEVGEFVMDIDAADRHDFRIDESYTVITATGRHELVLSGLQRFGEDNATVGATLMSMNTAQSNELFGTVGYDSIAVALTESARANLDQAQATIEQALPELDVLNQATLEEETAAEFNTQINIIQSILLGFAGISLLVSIFIIGNTFAIVLQQRTREMGLLRLVGADAKQLRRGALGEAGAIGVLASALGIPGGIAVAALLNAMFGAIGAQLPAYDTIVAPRTIIVALVVGLGVTMIAAWWPTRAATNVPAMAALRSGEAGRTPSYRTRTIVGTLLIVVGAAVAALGAASGGATGAVITTMAVGGVAMFIGVTLVSPRLVGPVATVFAVAFDRFGMPGRLAIRNARRQAGRTATSAAALMIGLAIVSMALVAGQSVKSTLGSDLEERVHADFLLTDQVAEAGFPTTVAEELENDPAFGAVTGFRYAEMAIEDEVVDVAATSFSNAPILFDISVSDGDFGAAANDVLVSRDKAETSGLAVGDTIAVTMDSGAEVSLDVTGIFDDDAIVEQDYLVDTSLFVATEVTANDNWLAFAIADGVDSATAEAAVAAFEERYPQGELETAEEFRIRLEGMIDQILSVMNALVALAIVIALIGIANTLALSVSERTREIGLLRAVGMSERAVRRMIRYESAIVAAFGAVLGVGMGIGLGALTVTALPASFADSVAIPGGQIVTLTIVATVSGLLAALGPARRAGHMNVLDAITA